MVLRVGVYVLNTNVGGKLLTKTAGRSESVIFYAGDDSA